MIKFLEKISKHHKVIFLPAAMCEGDVCKAAVGDIYMFRDKGHLTFQGSRYLGAKLDFYGQLQDQ